VIGILQAHDIDFTGTDSAMDIDIHQVIDITDLHGPTMNQGMVLGLDDIGNDDDTVPGLLRLKELGIGRELEHGRARSRILGLETLLVPCLKTVGSFHALSPFLFSPVLA
jgi:hypothetical protein